MKKEKIQWAYVGDTQEEVDMKENKRILLTVLETQIRYRYVCVDSSAENAYLKGEGNISTGKWMFAEIIKEPTYIPFEEGNVEDAKQIAGKVLIHIENGSLYIPNGVIEQAILNHFFNDYTYEDGSPVGKLREE